MDLDSSGLVTDEAMTSECGWTPHVETKLNGVIDDEFLRGELVVQSVEPLKLPLGLP
ncbi:MAG: hypothetical protein ACKVQS_14105 [Fimbriimonadaceae bacterium]